MSAAKILFNRAGGLAYALAHLGLAVAETVVGAVAETANEVAKDLARERQEERLRRQEAALDRVVKALGDVGYPRNTTMFSGPAAGAIAGHRRLDCRGWCGHRYQEDGVPLLFLAPDDCKERSSSVYAWMDGHSPDGPVWCTPRCRNERRPANPGPAIGRAVAPGS